MDGNVVVLHPSALVEMHACGRDGRRVPSRAFRHSGCPAVSVKQTRAWLGSEARAAETEDMGCKAERRRCGGRGLAKYS